MTLEIGGERSLWEANLLQNTLPPFIQSRAWGEFQAVRGKRVEYLSWRVDAQVVAQALLVLEKRRLGSSYWFAPAGPVFFIDRIPAEKLASAVNIVAHDLQKWAKGIGRLFIRTEPRFLSGDEHKRGMSLNLASFGVPVRSLNPAIELATPLTAEDAVQATFHQKTRYNIRVAERYGVTTEVYGTEAIDDFLKLHQETATRDRFSPHADEYTRALVEALAEHEMARIRLAKFEGRPLAGSIEIVYGDMTTYLFGASSSFDREKMAPYALHWSAMRVAMQEGKRWYNFGGGNPVEKTHRDYRASWEGVTQFKERWGTVRIVTPGTFDFALSPLYKFVVRR